jgi:DNA processing protein
VNDVLSPNTQAILLLTAPLLLGPRGASERTLCLSEYNRLAAFLRDTGRKPADLLADNGEEVIVECSGVTNGAQLRRLLARGFLLGQAVERWSSRAIWVLSRADAAYPRRLKARLGAAAPPVLYGCGDVALLQVGGLAVVGSRDVDDTLIAYSEAVGAFAAQAERAVVSGGARGVDQAAVRGALRSGGKAAAVLANSLEQAALERENRDALREQRLVLVSPYDPSAAFDVGHAMQRNKLIYALADAALVVNSDVNRGGTWAGAIEQLEKLHCVSVYVRDSGAPSPGLDALRQRGAEPWPEPTSKDAFTALLSTPVALPASA